MTNNLETKIREMIKKNNDIQVLFYYNQATNQTEAISFPDKNVYHFQKVNDVLGFNSNTNKIICSIRNPEMPFYYEVHTYGEDKTFNKIPNIVDKSNIYGIQNNFILFKDYYSYNDQKLLILNTDDNSYKIILRNSIPNSDILFDENENKLFFFTEHNNIKFLSSYSLNLNEDYSNDNRKKNINEEQMKKYVLKKQPYRSFPLITNLMGLLNDSDKNILLVKEKGLNYRNIIKSIELKNTSDYLLEKENEIIMFKSNNNKEFKVELSPDKEKIAMLDKKNFYIADINNPTSELNFKQIGISNNNFLKSELKWSGDSDFLAYETVGDQWESGKYYNTSINILNKEGNYLQTLNRCMNPVWAKVNNIKVLENLNDR